MQPPMSLLAKYLDEIGAGVTVPKADREALKSLPVFLSQLYEIYRADLFGREYSLLLYCGQNRPTPAEIEKHFKVAQAALGRNAAFVFLTLPTFDRKRLIQRRIPFVVPGRQAYLPGAVIDLREHPKGGHKLPDAPSDRLSAPSQVLLLYYFQVKTDSDDWPLGKWADVLGYSRTTLTRVCKELSSLSLCRTVARGRHVTLVFPHERRKLWESARPYLASPVRTRAWAIIQDKNLQLHEAGMTALARLTMIGPGRDPVFAMSSAAFEAARENRRLVQTYFPDEDTVRIERWKYAPGLLSPDSPTVDRLSLYLSLQDDPDERTQAVLAELPEQLRW